MHRPLRYSLRTRFPASGFCFGAFSWFALVLQAMWGPIPRERLIRALPRDPAIEIRCVEGKINGNTKREGLVADFIAEGRSRQEGIFAEQRVGGNSSCAIAHCIYHAWGNICIKHQSFLGPKYQGKERVFGEEGEIAKRFVLPANSCE